MEIAAQAVSARRQGAPPLNRVGDQQGVKWDPETKAVKTADGFPALLRKFRDNGFTGIAQPVSGAAAAAPQPRPHLRRAGHQHQQELQHVPGL
ncbi:MAG: hypothetical protein R3F43_18170 [bacterium]